MVSATPDSPEPVSSSTLWKDVKVADPDVILFDDNEVPIEVITDLTFEEIGGQEIINVARNDLVNGQTVIYKPIKNLQEIYRRYNSGNIIALQKTSREVFSSFTINLLNHVPEQGLGPNGEIFYLDPDSGDLVINVVNIIRNERVEVELINTVTSFNDTIYIED